MKSLKPLVQLVLNDLSTRCGISTTRDLKTISSRVEHEGLSFLTITLASFGEDFQKSLDQGYVDSNCFRSFSRTAGLPRFLGGFLSRVFDPLSGRLLDNPSVDAIYSIRQFTMMWSKINFACSPRRIRKALLKYIECESDLRQSEATYGDLYDFRRVGLILWADLFSKVDKIIYEEGIVPKHSPGSTADRVSGNRKYDQREWTSRLEQAFPSWENLIPSPRFINELERLSIREPGTERPVRVILVPKTLKTPRVIAMEPVYMQYVQQGILRILTAEFRRDVFASNFVKSDSQVPNQDLALLGSVTGELATLDLSEASDRVSNQLVRALLARFPHLHEAVDASRSRKADVPGHGVKRLAKFASMGSALCFPFEALVFTTIVFLGIQDALNRPLTRKDVEFLLGKVRVYGDDIIVPVDYVLPVIERLEAFGLRVNRSKSFWTGKFRESCGKDYYDGHDVSIVKVRSILPSNRKCVPELVSTVSLRNQLYRAGFPFTVAYLDSVIEKIIPFPAVEETSVLLGRHSDSIDIESWDDELHLPLVRGATLHHTLPVSQLDDYGALMKFFLNSTGRKSRDASLDLLFASGLIGEHLERTGRPDIARIKIRNAPPW